jgi:trehalose 6-phosphate phosphatase
MQSGKALIEVRPGSRDKGTSIRDFMREPPFTGRCPFFVGDDVGDEHGFDIVQRLGGAGIKVGTGHTRARYRLPNVAAVRGWMDAFFANEGNIARPS